MLALVKKRVPQGLAVLEDSLDRPDPAVPGLVAPGLLDQRDLARAIPAIPGLQDPQDLPVKG
jgi:hypothetical protein